MARYKTTQTQVREPQQDRAKRKVARILAAARKCFAKHGYAKTTMSRIAREARVSTGTAYAYFADKDDVLQRVLYAHVEEILQPAEAVMAAPPRRATLSSTLRELIDCSISVHRNDPGLHRVFHERVMKDESLRAMAAGFRERGLEIGRTLVKRFGGALAKKDAEGTAQVFIGLFEFCTHIGSLYPSSVTTEHACKIGIDMTVAYFNKTASRSN